MAKKNLKLRRLKGTAPGRRFMSGLSFADLSKERPLKKLRVILPKFSGRDSQGHVSTRHKGGRQKRFLREIDFKRDKREVMAKVAGIEYDPNRSANIALLNYQDGEKRYILSPRGLVAGDTIISSQQADIKPGNALPLKNIPVGTTVHNVEMVPGRGGQVVRSAGTSAILMSKEGIYVQLKMPSGEIRKFLGECFATVGEVGNEEWKNVVFGKAGAKRHRGIRPTVRGTAQHPGSHPHGGGEGRSGVGMKYPKTPWGKHALGKNTRKKKASDKLIVKRRK